MKKHRVWTAARSWLRAQKKLLASVHVPARADLQELQMRNGPAIDAVCLTFAELGCAALVQPEDKRLLPALVARVESAVGIAEALSAVPQKFACSDPEPTEDARIEAVQWLLTLGWYLCALTEFYREPAIHD